MSTKTRTRPELSEHPPPPRPFQVVPASDLARLTILAFLFSKKQLTSDDQGELSELSVELLTLLRNEKEFLDLSESTNQLLNEMIQEQHVPETRPGNTSKQTKKKEEKKKEERREWTVRTERAFWELRRQIENKEDASQTEQPHLLASIAMCIRAFMSALETQEPQKIGPLGPEPPVVRPDQNLRTHYLHPVVKHAWEGLCQVLKEKKALPTSLDADIRNLLDELSDAIDEIDKEEVEANFVKAETLPSRHPKVQQMDERSEVVESMVWELALHLDSHSDKDVAALSPLAQSFTRTFSALRVTIRLSATLPNRLPRLPVVGPEFSA